ncbi:MAG: 2-C-methyl-D-erythritol 4-phosphate cytidylyltransferase [Clostridia bacterium]|nr:2-C-methyl-D-erythritol 4-phosphate cytidylyltransferase [Clostridia bacterium]
MKISAVIVAAGSGTRMKAGKNKVFLELLGKTILEHTVSAFENMAKIDEIIVVTNEIEEATKILSKYSKLKAIVQGGAVRGESVQNGLKKATGDFVAIHDGARALTLPEDIENVLDAAVEFGAAALGVKCKDTLKMADENGFIKETVDREFLYNIQTPQVFRLSEIKEMYEKCDEVFTDDCALAEKYGIKVKIVDGSYDNIKITTPDDLDLAERILRKRGE